MHNACFILFLRLTSHGLVKLKISLMALGGYHLGALPFTEFLEGLTCGWMVGQGMWNLSGDIRLAIWDGAGWDGALWEM